MSARDARPWFVQAASDLRTAEALLRQPPPMTASDVGCHVFAMCTQALEKCIKAYVFFNGAEPKLNHRPDKYISMLVTKGDPLLKHESHHKELSKLFDTGTRAAMKALLDFTPGAIGNSNDVPNTEYPWKQVGVWSLAPCGAPSFVAPEHSKCFALTKRIHDKLRALSIAADLGSAF